MTEFCPISGSAWSFYRFRNPLLTKFYRIEPKASITAVAYASTVPPTAKSWSKNLAYEEFIMFIYYIQLNYSWNLRFSGKYKSHLKNSAAFKNSGFNSQAGEAVYKPHISIYQTHTLLYYNYDIYKIKYWKLDDNGFLADLDNAILIFVDDCDYCTDFEHNFMSFIAIQNRKRIKFNLTLIVTLDAKVIILIITPDASPVILIDSLDPNAIIWFPEVDLRARYNFCLTRFELLSVW